MPNDRTAGDDGAVTLQEAAALLGVHYMTVYRYVRLGHLPATKSRGAWRVPRQEVERFGRHPPTPAQLERAVLAQRVGDLVLRGDEDGAWLLLDDAARHTSVEDLYLDILRPVLRDIGEGWARGEVSVAQEHVASAVVTRLLGRLGHRLASPGRRRGVVVVGSPAGDNHALPAAMFADLLRAQGLTAIDLGSDTPAASFEQMLRRISGPAVVCLSATSSGNDESVRHIVARLASSFPDVPVAVGGGAVRDAEHAEWLGSAVWEPDPRRAAEAVAELLGR